MRLTLRTLLAYRDGVLGMADREDLHRRIQISQDAGNLLKRVGAVTKLNHVLAPPVLGKGMGGDPNSIAEYLDDALPSSQVPELERICLVSDVQLAELADCHELLSTAMNTKVMVPAELRRMALAVGDVELRRQLEVEIEARKAPRRKASRAGNDTGNQPLAAMATAEPAANSNVPVHVESPMLASGGESIKPQGLNLETTALAHEVPEYLMGSSSGNWKVPLAIGGLAALLAILVWQSLGPWEQITELFANVPAKSKAPGSNSRPIDFDLITETEQTPPGVETPSRQGTEPEVVEISQADVEADIANLDADEIAPPGAIDTDSVAPPGVPATIEEEGQAAAPPGLDSAVDVESPPKPPVPVVGEASADAGRSTEPATASTQAGAAAPAAKRAIWLPKDETESEAVLLRLADDVLFRVQAGEPLSLPLRLLVPPSTRTTIDLPGGVLWTACGPSLLEVRTAAEGQAGAAPRVIANLCRSLIRGGPDGRQVQLSTPVGEFMIDLSEPASQASIEVAYRPAAHGSVLNAEATRPVLIIVAEAGLTVTPIEPAGAVETLSLGDGLAVDRGSQPQKFRLQNIPSWIRTSVERPIDSLAALDLHRLVPSTVDPAVGLNPALLELSQFRRPETAALAVQISMMSGRWEPFVTGFLDNERMRSHWTATINLARQLLAGNAQQAASVKQQWIDRHGPDGEVLFDLLCGATADPLIPEGLAKIVQQLESSRLDHRVLAAYQLNLLTGKSLGFQPSAPNRSSVQQWRRELATNRIAILPVPDPVWERAPQ